jgi:pimeloyl-ACP methyl ester carboxylesterase
MITRRFFRGAGRGLAALDNGNDGAPKMILLHSMRDHALSMERIALEFADYHVIAPDLRGHGDSENSGSYAMAELIADLRALLICFEVEQPVVVGHSLGGQIAWRYSAVYTNSVNRLILIDGLGPPRVPEADDAFREQRRWRGQLDSLLQPPPPHRPMQDQAEAVAKLQSGHPGLHAEWARRLAERGVEPHPDGGVRWKWDPRINTIFANLLAENAERMYPLIDCPVQIIMGANALDYWGKVRRDLAGRQAEFDAALESRRRMFRSAEQAVIADAGHMVNYDQPDALNRAMRTFLSS